MQATKKTKYNVVLYASYELIYCVVRPVHDADGIHGRGGRHHDVYRGVVRTHHDHLTLHGRVRTLSTLVGGMQYNRHKNMISYSSPSHSCILIG